ncbi:MAG: thioredoxin family protein [Prevotella sp.]|nr:thioredoxin family protein [Prevotella sp.]
MKRLYFITAMLLAVLSAGAQMADPVHFTSQLKTLDDQTAELIFTGKIDAGWHVYSYRLGSDGPIEASFHATKLEGAELVGQLGHRGKEITKYDNVFGMTLRYFENSVTFVQKIKFTKPDYTIDSYLECGACNDEMCMPPSTVDLKAKGKAPVAAEAAETLEAPLSSPEGDPIAPDTVATDTIQPPSGGDGGTSALWKPVVSELKAFEEPADNSWWLIFFGGLLGGLLAVLTPCVWPIIPMTVSFFLKRNKERGKAIREALTYGASIVVIYVALGLLVTLIKGPNALNALSTNAWFNIFFALLLIVFAASFFGAFELTLPASWANKIDDKSMKTSGLLSIFLMAFTLVLVSFSCTGPIIGLLLVAVSAGGSILGPAVGMLGFSLGLAIPFALFALFPSLLKQAPKSGSWMNVIKVTLGFIELAFALKFLSVADLAYGWRLLDREVFLSLWIVIFGLLGAYLLGWLRFPHDDDDRRTNVPQFFLGLVSLAFTVYMVPGLWGAPLKAISAFTPPMFTQDFRLQQTSVEAAFKDYDEGMAYAAQTGKPVVIDFTGFGCVNCRKMEAAVWTDDEVARRLTTDYVLISLYVDDKTPLKEPVEVELNGTKRTLRTIGDRWSYLQAVKFGANTQPFYVLLDNEGRPLGPSRSYDEDIAEYQRWLKSGLDLYRK